MKKMFEPIRPLRAPDGGSAYFYVEIFGDRIVHYGESHWPSKSYWLVPNQGEKS